MVSKISIVIICFIAVGCMAKQDAKFEAGYNEQSLKLLVPDVYNNNDADHKLDSAIANASEDSVVFLKTISFLEKPFGDPNSQYRNESLYAKLLQAKIKSSWTDAAAANTARVKLYLLIQNKPGIASNDFTYTTLAGEKKKMYDVHAPYTLLYFYNPECDACKEMRTALANSEIVTSKVKSEKLKVLAVYIDRDEQIWKDHISEMPASWIQGRDENDLYKNKIYDLRAIPTIYLLDKNKKVLLKDCMDISVIEKNISSR